MKALVFILGGLFFLSLVSGVSSTYGAPEGFHCVSLYCPNANQSLCRCTEFQPNPNNPNCFKQGDETICAVTNIALNLGATTAGSVTLVGASGIQEDEVILGDEVFLFGGCHEGYSKIGGECMSDKVIKDLTNKIEKELLETLRKVELEKQIQIERDRQIVELEPLCDYCWDNETIGCYNENNGTEFKTCILERNGTHTFKAGEEKWGYCETHSECLSDKCEKRQCRDVDYIENENVILTDEKHSNNSITRIYFIDRVDKSNSFEIYSKFAEYPFYEIHIIPNWVNPKVIINNRDNNLNKEISLENNLTIFLDDNKKVRLIIQDFELTDSGNIYNLTMTFIDSKEEPFTIQTKTLPITEQTSEPEIKPVASTTKKSFLTKIFDILFGVWK